MTDNGSAQSTVPMDTGPKPSEKEQNSRIMTNDTVREGLARILVPHGAGGEKAENGSVAKSAPQTVFYNPIQQFNRDLSVLAIRTFGKEILARKTERKSQRMEKGLKRNKKRKRGEEGHEETSEVIKPDEQKEKINGDAEVNDYPDEPIGSVSDISTAPSTTPQFRILDALSATGLRALRYAHEIPFATSVTANDISPEATASIERNVIFNELKDKIQITTATAQAHMYSVLGGQHGKASIPRYDVIDLDPYGTAAPFLDAAVQAVAEGGLLCVTCTDSGVWASVGYSEKAFALYGGMPLKGPHSHEGGLRLILYSIATTAARYGLAIEPLLSLSIDFYARLFVKVKKSPNDVKFLAGRSMLVYSCGNGCGAWTTQYLGRNQEHVGKKGGKAFKHSMSQGPSAAPTCEHCGSRTHVSGPMYGGPVHSTTFIRQLLHEIPNLDPEQFATKGRLEGMLTTALEEYPLKSRKGESEISDETRAKEQNDHPHGLPYELEPHPLYFIPGAVSKILHCMTPSEAAVRGALLHMGYVATRSHAAAGSIKTNAPWSIIWEIMREWTRQKAPIKEGSLKPTNVGWKIMHPLKNKDEEIKENEQNQSREIIFDEKLGSQKHPGSTLEAKQDGKGNKKLIRYQMNPRANWGPMTRAIG